MKSGDRWTLEGQGDALTHASDVGIWVGTESCTG